LSVLPIVCYGSKGLREVCEPIGEITDDVLALAADMSETMVAFEGLGLAAPQVGKNLRMVLLNARLFVENPTGAAVVLINPELTLTEKRVRNQEGCLSLPDIYANVARSITVTLKATGLDGEAIEGEFSDLAARALQHEIDHLDGVLFIDHVGKTVKALLGKRLRALEELSKTGWLRRREDEKPVE